MNRPPFQTPAHPLYAWLATHGKAISAKAFAVSLGIRHQELSYYINGRRYIPLKLVRTIERTTGGRVGLGSWAKVRDWDAPELRVWRYGKASTTFPRHSDRRRPDAG